MSDQICELIAQYEFVKSSEVYTYEQAQEKFLLLELIEDQLYELGYTVED